MLIFLVCSERWPGWIQYCRRQGAATARVNGAESSIVTVFESENKVNKLIAVNRDAAEETVRDWTQPNTTSTIERYF